MQVFKAFFKIAKKQISACAIYLAIFAGITIMFTNMGEDQEQGYESSSADIAVFDYDNSPESEKLMEYLDMKHDIKDMEDNESELLDYLYYQELDYVLYIEEGYAESGELTNSKRPGSNTGIYIDNQIAAYEKSMSTLIDSGCSVDEAFEITIEALDEKELISVKGNASTRNDFYFYLYIPYALTMMLFNGLAPVIIAFNRKAVSDRTNISSMPLKSKNMQLMLGSVVLSTVMWVLFVAISILLYGRSETGVPLYGILNSFIYMILAVGIVSIVGNFNLNWQALSMVSNVIGMGLCFLGGIFVPMEVFSDSLLAVAKFIPTYWYVEAQYNIFFGGTTGELYKCFGIELLFALVFFAIALVISKRKRLSRAA